MESGRASPKQHQLAAAIVQAIKQIRARKLGRDDKEGLWRRIREQSVVYGRRRTRIRFLQRYAAAACLVLLGSLCIWWFVNAGKKQNELARKARGFHENLRGMDSPGLASGDNPVVRLENETTLYFGDTSLTAVGPQGARKNISMTTEGDYVTLAVPYGKRTGIVLPDSTKIWLNAGSYLTFPTNFMQKKREVFLEGEAFFEVAHINNRPFFVYTDDMQVKVLGTSFNVSSYKDDKVSSMALVEGTIELTPLGKANFEKQVLKKGITATFNKTSGKLGLETADVLDHVAWTRKSLVLKSTLLPDLIKKLERVYNAEIRYKTRAGLEDERFSGVIDLQQPLENVLKIIFEPSLYEIRPEGRRFTIKKR